MPKRAGCHALPIDAPWWLRLVRASLAGLRRKDRPGYRAIRGRIVENWAQLLPVWGRLTDEASSLGTSVNCGRLCARVLEAAAWWAAEERWQVGRVREAERELIELQDRIASSIDGLCEALTRTDELCRRFGLSIDGPHWDDILSSVLPDVAHKFGRWGSEPTVRALIQSEQQSFYSPRPGVLDLVRAARSAGAARAGNPDPPTVVPRKAQAAEALRVRRGSKAESEAAQLRQLFASLRGIALNHGWNPTNAGPLAWLTNSETRTLCCVVAGDGGAITAAHPWGLPSQGFELETVKKARAAFEAAMGTAGKPGH